MSIGCPPTMAHSATLEAALVQAYYTNPELDAQRAVVRATDEGVPQALAGLRPKIGASANYGYLSTHTKTRLNPDSRPAFFSNNRDASFPYGVGATISQPIFDGFKAINRTRAAESQVLAARETLRLLEQQILLDATAAYMNLIRDTAIFDLQRRYVAVVTEQLRQTRERYKAQDVTSTDVAQAESRLGAGHAQLLAAEATYFAARAVYQQVIGSEPAKLLPASPVDRLLPKQLGAAVDLAMTNHPTVTAAMNGVDVARLQIKIAEGELYPRMDLVGAYNRDHALSSSALKDTSVSVFGRLTVPLYQGGAEYSLVRQYKELLTEKQLDLDTVRRIARSNLLQTWGQLGATRAQIGATQLQVSGAEKALNGVRAEALVGQRSTIDVLNAQLELVNARVALVVAQRNRVVVSYAVLGAVGGLSISRLGIRVNQYDPRAHYEQVKDSWFGLRTPSER